MCLLLLKGFFIIMIEQTDASKSDERRVKNKSNPLTQKSKGETDTMGNRGIQLSVFFVIGLMLIAGLFSNTAMAADGDGKGTVTGTWGTINADDGGFEAADTGVNLNAGATAQALQFQYQAATESADPDNSITDDDTAIGMAGGKVRIQFPGGGWKVSAKSITVTDGVDSIYVTDADGKVTDDEDASEEKRVAFTADSRITVDLDSLWGSGRTDPARMLTIILGDVTVGIPSKLDDKGNARVATGAGTYSDDYAEIQFTASSSARNGTLLTVGSHPKVNVGSIDTVSDTSSAKLLEGKLDVKPTKMYVGNTETSFEIIFTAPGPIYGQDLNIEIPSELDANAGTLSIVPRGGATLQANQTNPASISILAIDKDQQVVVTYKHDAAIVAPSTGVGDDVSEFMATIGTADITKVAGGRLLPSEGSGGVTLSPDAVEAGTRRTKIDVEYTAVAKLTDVTLRIVPGGLVISGATDSTTKLQDSDPAGYGYVSSTSHPDALRIVTDANDIMRLEWQNLSLDPKDTVEATINRVDVESDANNYPWDVEVGMPDTEIPPGVSAFSGRSDNAC